MGLDMEIEVTNAPNGQAWGGDVSFEKELEQDFQISPPVKHRMRPMSMCDSTTPDAVELMTSLKQSCERDYGRPFSRLEGRAVNSIAKKKSDKICFFPNSNGTTATSFGFRLPSVRGELNTLRDSEVTKLLQFYFQPTDGTNEQRQKRLLEHLRIP